MIAYLQGKDTTVEVPDDIGDRELNDIQQNFEKYVQPELKPENAQKEPQSTVDVPKVPIPTGIPGVNIPRGTIGVPEIPKWVPNFYESYIKPSINAIGPFGLPAQLESLPEATRGPIEAFTTGALKQFTGGLAKPLLSSIDTEEKDHPAATTLGEMTGGLGSLLTTGGALRIAGLGTIAEEAGKASVEAGIASAQRFLPRAIMTGATFGTQTFVAHTIKAFQDGKVDLAQFGKDVLLQSSGGAAFGAIGGVSNIPLSVASAGGLGFVMSKMENGDNREALLNAGLFAGFEFIGSFGKTPELIREGLKNVENSIDDYVKAKDPSLNPNGGIGHAIVTVEAHKYGGVEELSKKENALRLIEDINQKIRQGKIPGPIQTVEAPSQIGTPVAPSEQTAPLPSQPSGQTSMEAEFRASHPSIEANLASPTKSQYDVAQTQGLIFPPTEISSQPSIAEHPDFIQITKDAEAVTKKYADLLGIEPTAHLAESLFRAIHADQHATVRAMKAAATPEEAEAIKKEFDARWPDSDREFATLHSKLYSDITEGWFNKNEAGKYGSMRAQAALDAEQFNKHVETFSKMAPEEVPEDLKDVYQRVNTELSNQEIKKNVAEISRQLDTLGIKPEEKQAIVDVYGLNKKSSLGQNLVGKTESDLVNAPIEEQTREIFSALAKQRGIEEGKPDSKTLEEAKKISELIDNRFNKKPAQLAQLVSENKNESETNLAQMAYDRGLIEEPSEDLLKAELSMAQESEAINPIVRPRDIVKRNKLIAEEQNEVIQALKDSTDELKILVNPSSAAPLAASILREQLGLMARSKDKAEASLEAAYKFFNKELKDDNIDFIDRMEHGVPQKNKELQEAADIQRNLYDIKRAEVQALGKGKLEKFIENYFAHIWEQGEKGVSSAIKKAAKRPLEGRKTFLKKRSIEFLKDGIEMGLTPVSYNPVELTLLKINEMDKYIMAHRTLNLYGDKGLSEYVGVGKDHPEGWQKIDDRISTIFKSPMVAVKEAFDEKMMTDLNQVAKDLGIDLERSPRMKGEGKKYGDVWGLSQSNQKTPGTPGKIFTRFAGPESALAHELGHQLDHIYGLQEKFLSDPKIDSELTELAKERHGDQAKESFKEYTQKPEEKMAAMLESYIHAPDLLKEIAPTTYEKLINFLKSDPKLEPLTKIKPSLLMGVNESEVYAGGNVIAGHIWAQPDAARIINNYLSPGFQKSSIFQVLRWAGNTINQFQLGISAFHANFTSTEAMASQIDKALRAVLNRDVTGFAKNVAKIPIAPLSTALRGNDLLKAWRSGGQTPIDEKLAQLYAVSGGRAKMDQFYSTQMIERMQKSFQSGKYFRGILQTPFAALHLASIPIMEKLVPRMKAGIFSEMMQMELEKNPMMTHEEAREIGGKIVDTIDDRMGQIVYDNLFWNRSFKDSLMLLFRSVGWNHGLIRLMVGGAKDLIDLTKAIATGKKLPKSYRFSYWISSGILTFMLNALYQKWKTGQGPTELKDYVFPKNGRLDSNGSPARSIPFQTYFKDLYHIKTAPINTLTNKLNPLWAMVYQAYINKDFYGAKIRNEDDLIMKQLLSEIKFAGRFVQPFSYRNMIHNLDDKNRSIESVVGPWLGDTSAPYDINQTEAEKLAHEYQVSHQQIGGRTQEQIDKSRLVRQFENRYKEGDPDVQDEMIKAYKQGLISKTQMRNVYIRANMTPLQKAVQHLTAEETQRVYDKASDEEKAQIQRQLDKKVMRTRVPQEVQ